MDSVPLWLSILLYAVAAIAIAFVLYLLMLYAMRQALREPLAELRAARRRQEDLLRDISTSAAYVADVADVWAEGEAERNASRAPRTPDAPDAEREAFGPRYADADVSAPDGVPAPDDVPATEDDAVADELEPVGEGDADLEPELEPAFEPSEPRSSSPTS